MRLSLTVPEQHDLDDPRVELDVRKLERVMSELPVLDAAESLYRLTGYLEPLNEQKLDSTLRYELLNVLAPKAQALFDVVSADNLNWRRLTSGQQIMVIDGIERAALAMADGFKIVLKHWFAEAVPTHAPKRYAQAIRRACRQLGNILVHAYRCQRAVPAYVRFEMHQLYRLGRHFGLLAQAGTADTARRSPSLAELCLSLMLLSALQRRLDASDVAAIYHGVLRHARHLRSDSDAVAQSGDGPVFVVDLNTDESPQAVRTTQTMVGLGEPCIIDARRLAEVLLRRLAVSPAAERGSSVEHRLLDALYAQP